MEKIPRKPMAISDIEIGYLAAMLDGEGSVILYHGNCGKGNPKTARLVIQPVTSTSPLISERVQEILQRAGIEFGVVHTRPNYEKGYRGSWGVEGRQNCEEKKNIGFIYRHARQKQE